MRPIRLLLTDDHQIVLDGLCSLIENIEGLDCVATATNGQEALDMLKIFEVDVVLMDIDMPVLNGIDATRRIKKLYPDMKVISLTQYGEKAMVKQLLDSGTDGYVLKNIDREELTLAIRTVFSGQEYFSAEVSHRMKERSTGLNANGISVSITDREMEILKWITEGLSSKEIADKLFISPRTVDTHRTNLMSKLDIHNIAGLIRFALKQGLS